MQVTQHENALYRPSEQVKFLDGNHITMCKFQNAFENGYVQITQALRKILTGDREFRTFLQVSLLVNHSLYCSEPIRRSSNDILRSSGILPAFSLGKKALPTKGGTANPIQTWLEVLKVTNS